MAWSPAQDESNRESPTEWKGTLVLVGGGPIPESIREAFARAGRAGAPDSRLVVIPTASERADHHPPEDWTTPWRELGFASIEVLHTRDRTTADSDDFVAPLRLATAVWITGGDQNRLAESYLGTKTEILICEVLQRNGAVGGTSAGAAIASRVMISGGRDDPLLATGFDLLPGGLVDQHFSQRDRQQRLRLAVQRHPDCIGLGIDESTAAIWRAGHLMALGEGKLHVILQPIGAEESVETCIDSSSEAVRWHDLLQQLARERNEVACIPAVRAQ